MIARAIRDWSNQDGRAGKCFGTMRDLRQARDLNRGNVIGSGSGPWVLGGGGSEAGSGGCGLCENGQTGKGVVIAAGAGSVT